MNIVNGEWQPTSRAGQLVKLAGAILLLIALLTFYGGVIYVAIHFIVKYW